MALHFLAGLEAPSTRTARDVLAQMEVLARLAPSLPPDPVHLIRSGKLRYAWETPGEDRYSLIGHGPYVFLSDWNLYREDVRSNARVFSVSTPDRTEIKDCEDLSAATIAFERSQGGRAWSVVQEWRGEGGQPLRWHAMALLELRQGSSHPAEIARPDGLLFTTGPAQARPGYRLAWVDPSWLAGMRRTREGYHPWYEGGGAAGAAPGTPTAYQLRLARAVLSTGWPDPVKALAVSLAESGGTPIISPSGKYVGPWQLDKDHPIPRADKLDPDKSTAFARGLWARYGWSQWGAATHPQNKPKYKGYLAQAGRLIEAAKA